MVAIALVLPERVAVVGEKEVPDWERMPERYEMGSMYFSVYHYDFFDSEIINIYNLRCSEKE
jgi:hypothetical protein